MRCSLRQPKTDLCDQGPHENTVYGVIKVKYIPTLSGQLFSTTFKLSNPLAVKHCTHRQYSSSC